MVAPTRHARCRCSTWPTSVHQLSEGSDRTVPAARAYRAERGNAALRRYLDANRADVPPYPTSRDLHRELQAETPDSLRYPLHDWLEQVTLWEVRSERATWRLINSARYRLIDRQRDNHVVRAMN